MKDKIKNLFLNQQKNLIVGILSIIPLLISFWIIGEIFSYFHGLFSFILGKVDSIFWSIFILSFSIFVLLFIGFKIRSYQKVYFISIFEDILLKIPFLSFIVKTFKELTKLFYSLEDTNNYLGVVKVPFNNGRTLGLITSLHEQTQEYTIFIPTAPNPTSGFVMYYKVEECEKLEMEIKEVFKIQLSLGTQSKK